MLRKNTASAVVVCMLIAVVCMVQRPWRTYRINIFHLTEAQIGLRPSVVVLAGSSKNKTVTDVFPDTDYGCDLGSLVVRFHVWQQNDLKFHMEIPYWLFIAGLMFSVCVLYRHVYYRYRRRMQGLCPHCSYDLTGNESGICPECGQSVNVNPVDRVFTS